MTMLLRHLIAIAALPLMATVVIPIWIGRRWGVGFEAPASLTAALAVAGGAVCLLGGLALFLSCVAGFATRGRGTLAPWDPPRHLVVEGPYRYVRNPMISGVMFVLAGEALLLRSVPHALWAVAFAALNFVFIPLVEEPQLERRFGAAYRVYRAHVPRFLPRLRPWRGADGSRSS